LNYKEEITKAMSLLAEDKRTLFIGQSVRFSGHVMFDTLQEAHVPMRKRIELPVFEDTQMGISIGLALGGFIPISIYPRMDFLIIAMNQLVNHLDKIEEMTCFKSKVIIRTMIGSKSPLNPGPQHCQDHTEALRLLLPNINVIKLSSANHVVDNYRRALEGSDSTILVEIGDMY